MEVGCRVQMTMETIHCGMESPFTIGNFCIHKSDLHWKIGKSFNPNLIVLSYLRHLPWTLPESSFKKLPVTLKTPFAGFWGVDILPLLNPTYYHCSTRGLNTRESYNFLNWILALLGHCLSHSQGRHLWKNLN
jgi:hypothetical protein